MVQALTASQLEKTVRCLGDWPYAPSRKALQRLLLAADFSQTFGLLARIALEAGRLNHHPEWLNVYNRLQIWLTTHDAVGVSESDITMARFIDSIASGISNKLCI